MSKTTIRCRFCDTFGAEADEDVLPRWLARNKRRGPRDRWNAGHEIVSATGGMTSRRLSPRQTAAVWKLKGVCKTCNRGWMSGIEDRAKGPLLAMAQRRPVVLSVEKRRDVVRWSQLKWICWDALCVAPLLARDVAHEFAKSSSPLASVSVHLAPMGVEPPGESEPIVAQICDSRITKNGEPHDLVHVTFKLDSLAVFVIGPTTVAPRWVPTPWTRTNRLVRFWPQQTTDDIRWDPSRPISIEEFDRLARGNR